LLQILNKLIVLFHHLNEVAMVSNYEKYLVSELASDEERYALVRNARLKKEYSAEAKLTIQVPVQKLKDSYNKYQLIICKGYFGSMEAEWGIASGHFSKLRDHLENKTGEVNFLDYLPELLPKKGAKVGLVTGLNGILNTPKDFKMMCESIMGNFLERPLFMGLYNPTQGYDNDLGRLIDHLQSEDNEAVIRMSSLFAKFSHLLLAINPDLRWLHVVHSEGGIITHRALENMSKEQKKHFSRCLITAAYGPVRPIPKSFARTTFNTYSDKDDAALRFGKQYLNNPDYKINITPCITPEAELSKFVGDHAFQGKTYQKYLKDDIRDIVEENGIFSRLWMG